MLVGATTALLPDWLLAPTVTFSSQNEFHALHPGHCPIHFVDSNPHSWQKNTCFSFAINISYYVITMPLPTIPIRQLIKCSLYIYLNCPALFKINTYAHLTSEVRLILTYIHIIYMYFVLSLRLKLQCDRCILWSLNDK